MRPGNKYDYIVVGGGLAGLYAAWKIRQREPDASIVVLEAGSRLGGRAGFMRFAGTEVAIGAGVGRVHKDRRLMELLAVLGLSQSGEHGEQRDFRPSYSPAILERLSALPAGWPSVESFMDWCLDTLLKSLQHHHGRQKPTQNTPNPMRATFRSYATRILGKPSYDLFVAACGYSDFENTLAYEAILNYGFDDVYNAPTNQGFFHVQWEMLIERLAQGIRARCRRRCRLLLNRSVSLVESADEGHKVHVVVGKIGPSTGPSDIYYARHVVMALPIAALARVKMTRQENMLRCLQCQPFLRVYAQVRPSLRAAMAALVPSYTIVTGPLQKVIPVDKERGVYMLAYADNAHAVRLLRLLQPAALSSCCSMDLRAPDRAPCVLRPGPDANAALWGLVEAALPAVAQAAASSQRHRAHITRSLAIFWCCGTHFIKRSPSQPQDTTLDTNTRFQHRVESAGLSFVGEAFSRNHQGWTEGALQSVDERV